MRRRNFIIGAAVLAGCSRPEQKVEPPANATDAASGGADDPAEVIRTVYAPYLAESDENLPGLLDRAPWSASLRQALIVEEARIQPGDSIDPDGLVFDPFISSQEWGMKRLNVTTEALVPESHAVVRASFNGNMEVVYDLIWEDGGWRVDNMRSGHADGWDLRRIVTRQ
jgi:hypothetical protein